MLTDAPGNAYVNEDEGDPENRMEQDSSDESAFEEDINEVGDDLMREVLGGGGDQDMSGSDDDEGHDDGQGSPAYRALHQSAAAMRGPGTGANNSQVRPEIVRMLLPNHQPSSVRERRTNETLIKTLKRNNNITCKKVEEAFRVCSRDIFVPDDQKSEAFVDHPLRLDADFNISAPHMHACMVQGLDVRSGDHVLDIGSGCGVTTAMFAYLTGKRGKVVGVELREAALDLSRAAMTSMMQTEACVLNDAVTHHAGLHMSLRPLAKCTNPLPTHAPRYASRACDIQFQQGNAFILPEHEGMYDKVHVGGLCEMRKLPALLKLLKPGKGCLVVPAGAELLCLRQEGDQIKRLVLAQVRFGELEVPSDADIVFGHLSAHRRRSMQPEEVSSCFDDHMAAVSAAAVGGGLAVPGRSAPLDVAPPRPPPKEEELEVHSLCTCGSLSFSPASLTAPRFSKLRGGKSLRNSSDSAALASPAASATSSLAHSTSTAGASSSATVSASASTRRLWKPMPSTEAPPSALMARAAVTAQHGEPDAVVRGEGFELPIHSVVLNARCPLIRKQVESGMSDADARTVTLPSHFMEPAVEIAVTYMYTDAAALDEELALPTLAVAVYLDMPHLTSLTSSFIVRHLQTLPVDEAVDAAAQLHVFAGDHGLSSLSGFCSAFLAMHFPAARAAPSYAALGAKQLREVLEALASERELLVERLQGLSCELDQLQDLAAS